jgi:hypothetical protein
MAGGGGPHGSISTVTQQRLDDILTFSHVTLPAPGIRGGTDAMTVTNGWMVVVVAVENSIYVAGTLHKTGNSAKYGDKVALASSSQPMNTHPSVPF